MGKSPGDEKLLLVFSGELHTYPLAVLRRTLADIHRHIKNPAPGATDHLGLAHGVLLIVQPTQDALLGRVGLVVLDKLHLEPSLLQLPLGPAFHKPATSITKDLGLDYIDTLELCFSNLHLLSATFLPDIY